MMLTLKIHKANVCQLRKEYQGWTQELCAGGGGGAQSLSALSAGGGAQSLSELSGGEGGATTILLMPSVNRNNRAKYIYLRGVLL